MQVVYSSSGPNFVFSFINIRSELAGFYTYFFLHHQTLIVFDESRQQSVGELLQKEGRIGKTLQCNGVLHICLLLLCTLAKAGPLYESRDW